MELIAILYSKKNYDLGYRIHNICKEFNINLVTALDFIELAIKTIELKPQFILCDCETVEVNSLILNAFFERNEFKDKKMIFVGGNENHTKFLTNYVSNDFFVTNITNLKSSIAEMQSDINFDDIATKTNTRENNHFDIEISKLLNELGFSLKYSGSAYLRYGLRNVLINNGVLYSLSSTEYPKIATMFKTTVANVERNIRNAIDNAWKIFGKTNWSKIFYSKLIDYGKKPTNREFMYMCAEILMPKLQQKVVNY